MMTRWNRTIIGGSVGIFLVGCSILSVQHPPRHDAPTVKAALQLRPGLTTVTVGHVDRESATIWWRSAWEGRSIVRYGKTPQLLPPVARFTPATNAHTMAIAALESGTRYFFQVETRTPVGVAYSAVCSFRTR